MARPELGTKRECPETGKKFYDMGKEPIVSPYTGKSYPLSFFEEVVTAKPPRKSEEPVKETAEEKPAEEEEDLETTADEPEMVSLEEAEADTDADEDDEDNPDLEGADDIPDLDEETLDDDSDEDVFLEDDEDDDDVTGIIAGDSNEDES